MSKFNIGDRVRITNWPGTTASVVKGQVGTVVPTPDWSKWDGLQVQLDHDQTTDGLWPCNDDELELI